MVLRQSTKPNIPETEIELNPTYLTDLKWLVDGTLKEERGIIYGGKTIVRRSETECVKEEEE